MALLMCSPIAKTKEDAREVALKQADECGWTECKIVNCYVASDHPFRGGWRWCVDVEGTPAPAKGPIRLEVL